MFTVKLVRDGGTMKIVEAQTMKIIPIGKPKPVEIPDAVRQIAKGITGSDEVHVLGAPVQPCTPAIKEIILTNNGRNESFFVGYEGSESIADPIELWNCAYIENAHGATTERVHGE